MAPTTARQAVGLEGATCLLGKFVSALRYDDLPKSVSARAKIAVLDWAGAALAGVGSDSARKLEALIEELGGPAEATVAGRRTRRPVLHAALANGVQAGVHEVDDVHLDCRIHAGLPVISAAFALAERERIGGRRLIEAVVAGYEVIVRLATALGVPHNNYWHSTGTAGAVGAAAAACKVIGLSGEQTAGGLGLGATQGAGLIDGIDGRALGAKHFHGGKAAQNGIWAALLAKQGYSGSVTAIEGEWGFLRAFAKGSEADHAALLNRLGEEWAILRTIFKPFACCLGAHAGVDALLDLIKTHGIEPERVESIEAFTDPSSFYMIRNSDPQDPLQAKFSLPFCLAAALVHRDLSFRAFDHATLKDPAVRGVMQRVRIEAREEIGRIQTLVRVRTREGQVLERLAERKGLDSERVPEKFRALVEGIVSPSRAEEIISGIDDLDGQADVRAVGSLLAAE